MQLDLFLHSADVGLRNAVVEALRAHDTDAMRAAIDRLRTDFPGDAHLDGFEKLLSGLLALSPPASTSTGIAEQLERVESQLLPSVKKLLGMDAAQRWIEPLYLVLARATLGKPFVRDLSGTHAAGLFLRAGALDEARSAAAGIPSWRCIPESLAWMAEIALRENRPDEFWPLLAELAWIAPVLFEALLARFDGYAGTATVHRLYAEFGSRAEVNDGAAEASWFPAWLLVEHPELVRFLRTAHRYDSPPARSAAVLVNLLTGERRGAAHLLADKRRQLREFAPLLFEQYMRRR